jgi:dienelactone hydrolase
MNRTIFATLLITATVWAQNGSSQGTGPFPALMEQDPGLSTHTVYRPQDMSKLNGQKLPVLAWGNGACVNAGDSFKNFLTEIASHGFLAIAIGPISTATPKPPTRSPAAERSGPNGPASMSSQLLDAVDWAIAENNRKNSPYFGKVDTAHIAVMGQSCGGIQTFAVAVDPRIKLMGIWNSGILIPDPNRNGPAMEDVRKEQLAKVHSPIFFFTGDKSDVAYPNGLDDFQRLTNVPAFHAYKDGMGHGGTYREPNGGELGKIASALLLWQLKGDKDAAKMFEGKDCGLCQDPKWHVSKKNMK